MKLNPRFEMRKAANKKKLSLFTFAMNLNWIDKVVVSFFLKGEQRRGLWGYWDIQ